MAEEVLKSFVKGMESLGFCGDEIVKSLKEYVDGRKTDNGEHN
jgi:DNA-binding transcriptional regulator YhcF (GntR family)